MKNKAYTYCKSVKSNDALRDSFNELTRNTFGFDFVGWYESGHWGDLYIPHVLLDGDKVISNVSVNLMQFDVCGVKKNYIQIGTVMTDEAYRGQGCNREIMEKILQEYEGKVDGIYLFGNDSVLDYYPKFGFKLAKEYEYYMPWNHKEDIAPYVMEKVDMAQEGRCEKLYDVIRRLVYDSNDSYEPNQNDGLYMSENLSLYQFWMAAGYGDSIYYLPECGVYVSANVEGQTLHVHQIWGKQKVEMNRLAKSFESFVDKSSADEKEKIVEVVLDYTPAQKEHFLVREHKEEDSTLFILGEDILRIEREQMMFPVLSHA